MLVTYFWNYLTICLVAYFTESLIFMTPQLPLLIAQIATTYLLEDTTTYVPSIIRSILACWYCFMQLAYPIPVFSGLVIGLAQGLLS